MLPLIKPTTKNVTMYLAAKKIIVKQFLEKICVTQTFLPRTTSKTINNIENQLS